MIIWVYIRCRPSIAIFGKKKKAAAVPKGNTGAPDEHGLVWGKVTKLLVGP